MNDISINQITEVDRKINLLAAIIRSGFNEFRKVKAASDQSAKETIQQ